METFSILLLPHSFAVCKLDPKTPCPRWAQNDIFYSATWTKDELSIICLEEHVPEIVHAERQMRLFQVKGTLDFGLVGILRSITQALADASISCFAISTYNTDYIMVKDADVDQAMSALKVEFKLIL